MSRTAEIPITLRLPRTTALAIITIWLLVLLALLSPQQLPIVAYKTTLVALAACGGYWIDRGVFPYARPDGYLMRDWRLGTDEPEGDVDFPVAADHQVVFVGALLRRAIIIAGAVVAVALGL